MTTTATKPAKLPREQDPRNPVHRLTALLDEGTLELITADDDSGMLAAVGRVDGTSVVAAKGVTVSSDSDATITATVTNATTAVAVSVSKDDALSVGGGRRRRRIVDLVGLGPLRRLDGAAPALAAGGGVEGDRQELFAVTGRHVDQRGGHHRRRLAVGDRGLPGDAARRREHRRVARCRVDARSVRAAELAPLRRRRRRGGQPREDHAESSRCAPIRHAGDSTRP